MTTIQIHLPDDLASKVFRLTNNAEALIIDFLQTQVQDLTLANQYSLAKKENIALQQAFGGIDLEGWENDY